MTLTTEDIAKFAGAFEYALMANNITREELADECGGIHISQFSKVKSEPDLVKIFTFGAAMERVRMRKQAHQAQR